MEQLGATMKKIVIVSDLPRGSAAAAKLRRLAFTGRVRLVPVDEEISVSGDLSAEMFHDCDAVICRPTDRVHLQVGHLEFARRPFYVASVSTGDDAVAALRGLPDVHILTSRSGNAPAAAELTIMLVNELMRRTHIGAATVALGSFRRSELGPATRMAGKTWFAIGAGAHVRELLPRIMTWGLDEFVIWNDRMSREKLEQCLANVPGGSISEIARSGTDFVAVIRLGMRGDDREHVLRVIGTSNFSSASRADVVSIHVPAIASDPNTGRAGTNGLVTVEFVREMKRGALLVNVARGEILDGIETEQAVVDALETGRLGGFASDVLARHVEKSSDPSMSPLWTRLRRQDIRHAVRQVLVSADESQRKDIVDVMKALSPDAMTLGKSPLNLILTPHLGGETDIDFENVLSEVTDELLKRLGIPIVT